MKALSASPLERRIILYNSESINDYVNGYANKSFNTCI